MAENTNIPWGLAQRFEFIEWRAYWVGRLNRKDLEDEFKISTPPSFDRSAQLPGRGAG